jgi:hypothetical protein
MIVKPKKSGTKIEFKVISFNKSDNLATEIKQTIYGFMKKIFLMVVLAAISCQAFAQDTRQDAKPADSTGATASKDVPKPPPMPTLPPVDERAKQHTSWMKEKLKLTETQEKEIYKINLEEEKKKDVLMTDKNAGDQLQQVGVESGKKILKLLTAEQSKIFKETMMPHEANEGPHQGQ